MEAAIKPNTKEQFLANFIPLEVPGIPVLNQKREEAEKVLARLDFPTSRDEHWKYTRISKILNNRYTQSPPKGLPAEGSFYKMKDAHLLVFINGFFSTSLSSIGKEKGAIIKPLARARTENAGLLETYFGSIANPEEIFTSMNTVYHTNGIFIYLKENTKLAKPVQIVNLGASERAACNPRNLIILENNSSGNIVFSYESIIANERKKQSPTLVNSVTEIHAAENSKLSCYLLQDENESAFQINSVCAELKNGANAEFFTITSGGEMVRNNLNVSLDGENCVTHMHGLYPCKGNRHVDNHTVAEHKKPNSFSNELYKGIMSDKSTGVFNGKVKVYKDAQKTNAYQSNQNILLSDGASVNSKPELEIYANDVKCSHGSTIGQLDDEAVFYLRSRGINEDKAIRLLVNAFAGEVVENIGLEEIKQKVAADFDRYFE